MKQDLGAFLAPMVALALVLGTSSGRAGLIVKSDCESPTLTYGASSAGTPDNWIGSSRMVGICHPVTPTQYGTIGRLNPNGNWTLFLADLSDGGGQSQLTGLSMDITAVPEPG